MKSERRGSRRIRTREHHEPRSDLRSWHLYHGTLRHPRVPVLWLYYDGVPRDQTVFKTVEAARSAVPEDAIRIPRLTSDPPNLIESYYPACLRHELRRRLIAEYRKARRSDKESRRWRWR